MSRRSFVVRHPVDRERIAELAWKIADGSRVDFSGPRRSNDQNAKLWVMLTKVSEQVEWYGKKLSTEDWKDMFTASLRKARVVPGIDNGSFVPLGMRTSDMDSAEFSDLIELINAFAAERGVNLSAEDDINQPEVTG
ncbi:recombination protein NinB [Aureimonas fodinaquatilis]|uniref:Recombination protein NinB n=1 Tax=Aureimonas fodinaquatilis TaxID=2565783 RepID=A0A5B0DVS5_9HYPH|nr:recombination protein NinB [Aureimonas fodinaquatilis]KAA0970844.1 recombination protein NinB [Aureimonas fodinaquatilis]